MPSYQVTGTIDPDATGVYSEAGSYGGQPYYQRASDDWYLFWYTDHSRWYLSEELGSIAGDAIWQGPVTGAVTGSYPPYGDNCEGTAVVSLYDPDDLPNVWAGHVQQPNFPPPPLLDLSAAAWQPDPSTFVEPPIPGPDAWCPGPQQPIFPVAWLPEAGPEFQPDPSTFVEPPDVLADDWCPVPLQPLFPPQWLPPTESIGPGDPSVFVTPGPPLLSQWYAPPLQPIWPPPKLPMADPGWCPLDWDTAPPLNCWCGPIEQPRRIDPRTGLPWGFVRWTPPTASPVPPIRYRASLRGLYRVFNVATYRFYRSDSAPPEEGDTPFATSVSLPHTPTDTYADGTWYLACSWCNGVLDSGFLPIGPNGERYLRLDLSGGQQVGSPPPGPMDWRLELRAGGVVQINAWVFQSGDDQADQWAIAYTTDGSTPATDSPDLTQAMTVGGLQVLQYDLPGASHGATVKVRLQTRRNDGTQESPSWVYSADSEVESIVADAVGPSAPLDAERWAGALPEE